MAARHYLQVTDDHFANAAAGRDEFKTPQPGEPNPPDCDDGQAMKLLESWSTLPEEVRQHILGLAGAEKPCR